jgi:hypothetical protein
MSVAATSGVASTFTTSGAASIPAASGTFVPELPQPAANNQIATTANSTTGAGRSKDRMGLVIAGSTYAPLSRTFVVTNCPVPVYWGTGSGFGPDGVGIPAGKETVNCAVNVDPFKMTAFCEELVFFPVWSGPSVWIVNVPTPGIVNGGAT